MVRLQARLAGGAELATLNASYDESSEWVNALIADVPGLDTASASGSVAFVEASEDLAADAISISVQGDIANGSLRVTIRRPIYSDFKDAANNTFCWGGVACEDPVS